MQKYLSHDGVQHIFKKVFGSRTIFLCSKSIDHSERKEDLSLELSGGTNLFTILRVGFRDLKPQKLTMDSTVTRQCVHVAGALSLLTHFPALPAFCQSDRERIKSYHTVIYPGLSRTISVLYFSPW